jgi:hypothetical protein
MIHPTNKDETEIIRLVTEGLIWYNHHSSTATIPMLLEFQDKLSILSVNLAEITGQTKGSYLRAYFQRKVTHSITKLALIENGDKIGVAEEKALKSVGGLKESEMNAEEASYTITLQLRQINKVLSACSQRISFAKSEKEQSDRQRDWIEKQNKTK